jgi:hypothetical protein
MHLSGLKNTPCSQSSGHQSLSLAIIHLCSVKQCCSPDCLMCNKLQQLLGDENVAKYLRSDDFSEGRVPVETAMCDKFQGWGNFLRNEFGINSNVCKPHAVSNVLYSLRCSVPLTQWPANIAALQYSHLEYFPSADAYHDFYDIVVDIC